MTQSDLVQLAQAGDVTAIATLMNTTLQALGITARVALRERSLYILLESERVLAQTPSIQFIQRGISRLGAAWLSSAVVYSRVAGETAPSWVQRIDVHSPNIAHLYGVAPGVQIKAARIQVLKRRSSPWNRGRLFDLLLLSVPLLVVLMSGQIWSRYLVGSSYSQFSDLQSTSNQRKTIGAADLYDQAISRALIAVKHGKVAQSRHEWHQAADAWWQAIELLKAMPKSHPNYTVAQQKIQEYEANLDTLARDKLSVLPGGMELKKVISGGISPKSIVYSGKDQFFAQNMMYGHTITVYDREYNLIKTISDSVNLAEHGYPQFQGTQQGAPVEAAFSQDGQVAWVSNYEMSGEGFSGLADDDCSPAGNHDPSFLYRINTGTLKIDHVVQVGAVPKFVAASPNNRLVLVSNWCSWDVSVVDTQQNKEIRRIQLGPYPRGIAIDNPSGKAYVAVMGSYDVAAIDLNDFSVSWLKGVGHSPRHLNLDPAGKYLYASLNGEGQVVKIDLATGAVVGKAAAGDAPRSMAISADGKFIYVVNYNSDTVSKIRTTDMQLVQTVDVNPGPIGVTYDPKTHQVWVACYSGSILVFQD